jgi:hypothetical protein
MCKRLPTLRSVLAAFPKDFSVEGEMVGLLYAVLELPKEEAWSEDEVEGEEPVVAVETAVEPTPPCLSSSAEDGGGEHGLIMDDDGDGDVLGAYEAGAAVDERVTRALQQLSMEEVQARVDALLEDAAAWSGPQMGWGDVVTDEPTGGLWCTSPASSSSSS